MVAMGVDALAKNNGMEKSICSLPPPQPPDASSAARIAADCEATGSADTSVVHGSGCWKRPPAARPESPEPELDPELELPLDVAPELDPEPELVPELEPAPLSPPAPADPLLLLQPTAMMRPENARRSDVLMLLTIAAGLPGAEPPTCDET
jgi:hypothetical protein